MAHIIKTESSFKCQEIDAGRTLLLAAFDEFNVIYNNATPEVDLVTRVLANTSHLNDEDLNRDILETPFLV